MKILSRIDGSVCGAIISTTTRTSAARAAVSSRQKLREDGSTPRAPASQCRQSSSHAGHVRPQGHRCPQTASWLLSTFLPAPSRRRPGPSTAAASYNNAALPFSQRVHRYSHATAAAQSVHTQPDRPVIQRKEELLEFVDDTDVGSVDDHLTFLRDPYLNKYAQPEPTKVVVTDRQKDLSYPSMQEAVHGDQHLIRLNQVLRSLVGSRQRRPDSVSLDRVYAQYLELPVPRMIQMPAILRHRLLTVFGAPPKRDVNTMLRYFSLVGDVKDSGLSLRRNEWNYALSLASRYVGRTTAREVEALLLLWREMEKDADVAGNDVTFNILFDAASKAGNFELAEMIYKEMEKRGISFTRYHHVSLIHYFGLKQDADGIRAAYKEAVESGELVDTAVLNCVISSFLRCKEDEAALKVYEHMKATHSRAATLPGRDYGSQRIVTQTLRLLTKVGKKHPALRKQFQELVITAPDLRTYRALINHFAIEVGDLNKVAQLMDEMKWFEIPMHGSIFLTLFKGFKNHGGFHGSQWTSQRLQGVFTALMQALEQQSAGIYLDTWLMMAALRAFEKCTNKDTVVDVYEQFKSRWTLGEDKAQFMDSYLIRLMGARDQGHVFTLDEAGASGAEDKPKPAEKRPL
ncbi:pentatricopeptide repeat protein [Colletotrichum plurivorum]|uniref:Pentatricopeptide repeat protein n=1 Tax=Colletotrichum plurivorum TaxID=2175906 RepID=A0A8H6KHZ4_9PEZI|nr:pentatricopeptide repeat protein [Colletotrichum plurivorum]